MSQAIYNYVGPEEIIKLSNLVIIANMKKAVNDASISIYKDFVSITIRNCEETTFYISFKYDQDEITDIFSEKNNYEDYLKCTDLLDSLIKKNGGKA